MKIIVNGEERIVEPETTIAKLFEILNIPYAGTAVAVGDTIVPRSEHDARVLSAGDRVEVIRAIGGG